MIEIKSRWTGAVLFAGEFNTVCEAVEAAVRSGASLVGANLDGASLVGANLYEASLVRASLVGANLYEASLDGASLVGANLDDGSLCLAGRAVVQIGPIGSRDAMMVIYATDRGLRVRTGCFFGDADAFLAAVDATHNNNRHARDYRAAMVLARSMLAVDEPAAERVE